MDLGRARLRKIGLNNLRYAVHPQHGVIWTDGKGIYLAPIHVEGQQVQNAASVKVGEFENVTSVHWSSTTNDAESCHMCVVHQQNVTVWRVSGSLPKLIFKQVRKINVRPVPQGCLWNPRSDVLCLLSRHQCSFYYRHDINKANYAFPALESSSISCGCWSQDGTKLILCVGAALLIYRWSDVNAAIEDFSAAAWKIPGLVGKVTSITPVLKDSFVVAAEVPLESLCKQSDMFKVPDTLGDNQKNGDGIIRPNKSTSVTESLLNLQPNTQAVTDSRSSLTMIQLPGGLHDPIKLSTVSLKGALTPDILMYEKSSQCVVVASNSQSQLQIYALLEKYPVFCGNIQLDKDQRPKGLCPMPTLFDDRGAAILILVGQREVKESALIAPSTEADFRLSMKYIILKTGYNHLRQNGSGDSSKVRSSSLIHCEKLKPDHEKHLSESHIHKLSDSGGRQEEQKPHSKSSDDQIKIPTSANEEPVLESEELLTKPIENDTFHKAKLIDDLSSQPPSHTDSLEIDTVSFSSQAPSFNNSKLDDEYCLDPVSRIAPNDQPEQLHSSIPSDMQFIKAPPEDDLEKTDAISKSSVSKELQPLPTFDEHLETDKMLKEPHKNKSHLLQRQSSLGDAGSDIYHPPTGFHPAHDNAEKKLLSSHLQPEIEPEIIIPSQIKRDSRNHFSSLQPEIQPEIIIPSQIKREFRNDFYSLPPETKSETSTIVTQSETSTIVTQSETGIPSNFSSSQPETKSESTIIIPHAETNSPSHFSSSQPEIIIPFQIKRDSLNHSSSLQPEIEHEIIIPSEIKRESCINFSSLQPETESETATIISQPETKLESTIFIPQAEINHLSHFSSSQPEIIIPFQIKKESINHFSSLQPEIEHEIIIPSEIKRESYNLFSSLQPETTTIISQPETKSATTTIISQPETKSESTIIIPQAKINSPSHFSSSQPEIIIPFQIKRDSLNHFSSLQPEIEHEVIVPSEIKRESCINLSSLQPEAKPESTTIMSQPDTQSPNHFSSLQPEIEPEIIIPFQLQRESLNHFSSLQPETEHDIIMPTEIKRENCKHFLSLQPEIQTEIIISSSQRKPINNFSSLQPETKSETTTIISQPATKSETTTIISQAETKSPNHFSCLQSEIKPEIIIPSQIKRESHNHFSSLKPDTKSETTLIVTQTEQDFPSQSPSSQPVTTPETRTVISQTETNIPINCSKSQSNLKPRTVSDSFGAEGEGTDLSHSLQSELVAGSHEDNSKSSDLRDSLQEQDLDHAKDDTLSDLGYRTSERSLEAIWDAFEKQTKSQKDSIDALYRRLELLSTAVDESSCVFPTKYQDMSHPEMVEISCERPEGNETKMFLLDNGRLQLDPIKLAFGLATVELWLDGILCVLGPNIDGYIPLKFIPGTKLQITGLPMSR